LCEHYKRSSIRAVADFKAITCPLPPKFIKCTDLRFTTSPAIALIQCCMPVLFLRPSVGQPYSLASFGFCGCFERLANVYGCVRWLVSCVMVIFCEANV